MDQSLASPRELPAPRGPAPAPRRTGWLSRRTQLTLLHLLSLSRLGFAVLFLMHSDTWVRVGLIALSGFTDVLDGWIARHARLTSRLGALIDPVADRGFAVTAILTLLMDGLLTPLQVTLLLLRDAATALGFVIARLVPALRPVEFKARMLGKAVTTLQAMTLLAALLVPAAVPALVAVVGVTALASVVDYARAVLRARGQLPA
ncbi:CDP-alcohol phosphatidyltransferase family protein [Stigmatella erecta]|uniref:CDP-diacylglycerol--glycerol-3-phosphate 3-phosphatidyltransferase n=1 Tax=Stigmatella erecta TaxID=83460 RepID=A0A1I0IXZ3_9BACT|nr:CDP-alcohol phosphatidyltransferase family protein [Stigmatella erecta]SEU02289.1 CDP-diacylglycerol--glycerol-3-phosphate 3-phosphatidyltransferase [Stigmatella erecta]